MTPNPKLDKPSARPSLDYTSDDATHRLASAKNFLESCPNPSPSDLALLTDYICCAKLPNEQKSPVQQKTIYLERKPRPTKDQSLEALLDQPSFNESQFTTIPYTQPKPTFSRQSIDPASPTYTQFVDLWDRIDSLARTIAIAQHKTIAPPPTPQELDTISSITSQQLYHLKQTLVELRREQFTLSDIGKAELMRHDIFQQKFPSRPLEQEKNFSWEDGFAALAPLGPWWDGGPFSADLRAIDKKVEVELEGRFVVDFCNEDHLKAIVEMWPELSLDGEDTPICQTFAFYEAKAYLPPEHLFLLDLRKDGFTNRAICKAVNEKFGTNHTETYTSTLFTKKICKAIAAAAQLAADSWERRGEKYAFKVCKDCGEVLLLDERNWAHQARSSDKFSNHCKRCDSEKRRRKEEAPPSQQGDE